MSFIFCGVQMYRPVSPNLFYFLGLHTLFSGHFNCDSNHFNRGGTVCAGPTVVGPPEGDPSCEWFVSPLLFN